MQEAERYCEWLSLLQLRHCEPPMYLTVRYRSRCEVVTKLCQRVQIFWHVTLSPPRSVSPLNSTAMRGSNLAFPYLSQTVTLFSLFWL